MDKSTFEVTKVDFNYASEQRRQSVTRITKYDGLSVMDVRMTKYRGRTRKKKNYKTTSERRNHSVIREEEG